MKTPAPSKFWFMLWMLICAPLAMISGLLLRCEQMSGHPTRGWAWLLVDWLLVSCIAAGYMDERGNLS